MNKGSCHCKQVDFEISGALSDVYCCYCETCRKLSGAAYSVVARVGVEDFKLLKGKQLLQTYESTPGKIRYHCDNCSSPIYVTVASQPDFVRIRLGTLDYEPEVNIVGHIWVSEKPDWHVISDSLPQYDEWP